MSIYKITVNICDNCNNHVSSLTIGYIHKYRPSTMLYNMGVSHKVF